jgi:hypothetical protein
MSYFSWQRPHFTGKNERIAQLYKQKYKKIQAIYSERCDNIHSA